MNELWEGPRNVLLSQIHRDLQKVRSWYAPADFVRSILAGANSGLVADLAKEIGHLVAQPSLIEQNASTVETCIQWDKFCHRLFHTYQDLALEEILHPS